jgi:hypothetical protein
MFCSCFTYGSPDSIFVNFVGKDLDNFLEYKQSEIISIDDKDLTIIYQRKTYDQYSAYPNLGGANNPGDNSYLIVKKINENSEQVIFQGNLGHEIKYVFIDKINNCLYYTLNDNRKDLNIYYLIYFDLIKMQEINKITVIDTKKYKNPTQASYLSGGFINNAVFDHINKNILFTIHFYTANGTNGNEYISLNINTGKIDEISENIYKDILEYLYISENSFTYSSKEGEKKLFVIAPYSDYLPANYKHKYNGLYIYDGVNNIRISKLKISYSSNNPIWFNDGQCVFYGSHLFDTSGRKKEAEIVDGIILAVY